MTFAERYLAKHTFKKINFSGAPSSGLLKYIVVIPAYSEPGVVKTLESIRLCHKPAGNVEVLVNINFSENAKEEIKEDNCKLYRELTEWAGGEQSDWLKFNISLSDNLPKKHAGAGLARKIGMDAAVARFSEIGHAEGIILSLDADTLVPPNYFTAIESQRACNPKTNCFIFNFAHPTIGDEFKPEVYEAIKRYEIYLRYYKIALQQTGFPFYYFTIGSCFGVTAKNYVKHGGMSRRHAGEDFYFLHKVFPNSTTTFFKDIVLNPSPRPSWRVPFGTGPAIQKMLQAENIRYLTYHPALFEEIKTLMGVVPSLFNAGAEEVKGVLKGLPETIRAFLEEKNFQEHVADINKNSSSLNAFTKRFFGWFDAFQVIKYLNFASESSTAHIDVLEAVRLLLPKTFKGEDNADLILMKLRTEF